MQFLTKRWSKNLSHEEILSLGFLSLKEANDGRLMVSSIRAAILDETGNFKILSKKDISLIFSNVRLEER